MTELFRPNLAGIYQQNVEGKRRAAELGLRKETLDAEIANRQETQKFNTLSKMLEVAGPGGLPDIMRQMGELTGVELDLGRAEEFAKDWKLLSKLDKEPPEVQMEGLRNILTQYKGIPALERERKGLEEEISSLGEEVRTTVRRGIPASPTELTRATGATTTVGSDIASNLASTGQPELGPLAEETRERIQSLEPKRGVGADSLRRRFVADRMQEEQAKKDAGQPFKSESEVIREAFNLRESITDPRSTIIKTRDALLQPGPGGAPPLAKNQAEAWQMANTTKSMSREESISFFVGKFITSALTTPTVEEIDDMRRYFTEQYDSVHDEPEQQKIQDAFEADPDTKGLTLGELGTDGTYQVFDKDGRLINRWRP